MLRRTLLLLLLLLLPHRALATPRAVTPEDAVLDGELDAEDLVAHATVGRALPPAAVGSAWLSVVGLTRSSLGEREVGGFAVVGLPLDRFARASTRVAAPRPVPTVLTSTGARPEVGPLPLTLASRGGGERGAPGTLPPRLARDAVAAAWRAAGLGGSDARLDAIVTRARWSAALPEARLRAVRFEDQRLSTDTTVDASRLRDSTAANVGLEARLTWRLDRLLYANDEPAFERMRLERHDARMRIAGRVLEALFHWHRALVELRGVEPQTVEEVEAQVRLSQAEATLDVLTGGWFAVAGPRGDGQGARGRGQGARDQKEWNDL